MIVDLAGNDFKVVGASAVTVWHVTHGLTVPTSASPRSPHVGGQETTCASKVHTPISLHGKLRVNTGTPVVGESRLVLMRAPPVNEQNGLPDCSEIRVSESALSRKFFKVNQWSLILTALIVQPQ